jgi:hypothetical protein
MFEEFSRRRALRIRVGVNPSFWSIFIARVQRTAGAQRLYFQPRRFHSKVEIEDFRLIVRVKREARDQDAGLVQRFGQFGKPSSPLCGRCNGRPANHMNSCAKES